MADTDLTELIELNPFRVDGVKTPASGFPILLMKSTASKAVNAQGGINEKPDIDAAEQVLQLLARLIQAEAAEMAVGQWNEICDISLLCEATHLMQCFRRNEMWGDEDDGEAVAKDADFPSNDELESVVTYLLKRKVSSAERKRLASEGNALPDGSYPIENAEDLHNAAVLARSGHGDVSAAKKLIARRAKELGVPNPLADSAAKDTELPQNEDPTPTPEPTPTPDVPVEKSLDERIEEAVAKAVNPLTERNQALEAEMAALKALPIPGSPAVTAPVTKGSVNEPEKAKQLARFERLAKDTQDRELARYYAERAAELKSSRA
jgi:hypothetical protein